MQDEGQVTGRKQKNPTNQPNQKTNFGTGIQDLDSWFPTCYIEPLQ